jgi:hypothetical protein
MQALLTKHAFERSNSEDPDMLEGHNQTLALPSHRIQEILTEQTLITALMLAVKHCQAIPRYSRWIAAEEALMRNMGQNLVAGLNLPKRLLITHLDLQWSSAADPASTADTPLMSVSKSLLCAMTLNGAVSSKDDKAWVSSTVTDGKPEPTQGWASKLGSSQFLDPQTDHGLPARLRARLPSNNSKNGNSFQETATYNSDEACNRGLSPEANVEAPGPVIASESTANQMLHKTSKFSMRGCTRQCPNSDVEAIHQDEESDADVRDHSLPGTKQDVFCRSKDGVHVALGHVHECTVPSLDHCSIDGNGTLAEFNLEGSGSSTCDNFVDESAMGNGSTVLWKRLLRSSHAKDICDWKSMKNVEQVARNAMLSFGFPTIQVQWLCMA